MQKGYPCRELNPCRKCREWKYIVVMGDHTGKHRKCRYMVMGTVPLVQKVTHTGN